MSHESSSPAAITISVRHLDDGSFYVAVAMRVPPVPALAPLCEPEIRDSSAPGAGAYTGQDAADALRWAADQIDPNQLFQPPLAAVPE